jgi:hypothetical protein
MKHSTRITVQVKKAGREGCCTLEDYYNNAVGADNPVFSAAEHNTVMHADFTVRLQ